MNTEWKWMKELNSNLFGKNDPLLVAFDCFSVFGENKGILLVLSENEVVSVKLSITTDLLQPLQVKKVARLKGVNGLSVVRDHRNSFLLTKDMKIFAFESPKRIFNDPVLTNVKFFECFNNSCYAVVEQIGIEVKLLLYDSLGNGNDERKCEFDLSFPQDAVTLSGSRENERITVEIIEGATNLKFFDELLACNLIEELITDVVLISIDEKLMWVKFKNSFAEGAIDGYTIETITVAKGKIRGLKYFDGMLLMLDDLSILSVFYLCPLTQLIRKKEILLEGKVKCFRFHQNRVFVYSNVQQVIFMDLNKLQDPTTHHVALKGIACFTIVDHPQNFIIGICRNKMFYHINFPSFHQQQSNKNNQFIELEGSDVEAIPEVAKFLENGEKSLLEIDQKIKRAQVLRSLIQHLATQKDFKSGEATIKFHRNFPEKMPDDAIVCKVTDQKLGCEFIEIQLKMVQILKTLTSFDIIYRRHGSSGVITKTLNVAEYKEIVHILMPAEKEDHARNKMSLDLSIIFNVKGRARLISYPVSITEVNPSTDARICILDSLDTCLKTVTSLKM